MKSRKVESRADQEAVEQYGRSREEARSQAVCVRCGSRNVGRDKFRDEASWREYNISFLCQKCQDGFFGRTDGDAAEEPGPGHRRVCQECGQFYSIEETRENHDHYFDGPYNYAEGCDKYCLACWLGVGPNDEKPEATGRRDMKIVVEEPTQIRIAQYGPNRLFGDYRERQELARTAAGGAALQQRFVSAWNAGLEAAVKNAQHCLAAWARERLTGDQQRHLDDSQEHRHFRYQNMEFVAQLRRRSDDEQEITQLWKIPSGDDYPRVLWITFDSVEERLSFVQIASQLGYRAEDLGLELVRDFMNKFGKVRRQEPRKPDEEIPF